jgi:uncharacterized RDD family membrane protein YckC
MKCPKCHYLSFETGDRCRNCGYDFSLMASVADTRRRVPAPQPSLGMELDRERATDEVDRLAAMPLHDTTPQPPRPVPVSRDAAPGGGDLPLFTGATLADEPLVRFPAPPRAPVAVRKTPEIPRIKPAAASRRRDNTPGGDSLPELAVRPAATASAAPPAQAAGRAAASASPGHAAPGHAAPGRAVTAPGTLEPSSTHARVSAALLDLGLLAAVDLIVIYFTLRMASLTMGEWRLLPPLPLIAFLLMLKSAYYFAFTAIGGQTIGKMAMHIRVVPEAGGRVVAPALAFRRTLAAATALLTLGGTFIPALVGRDRRAVHDRVAHTRVVALPGA